MKISFTRKHYFVVGFVAVFIAGIFGTRNFLARGAGTIEDIKIGPTILTETVGTNVSGTGDILGVSWPGEIISLGDVEVQPRRGGSITEWKVNIGQRVVQGQIMGYLSAPPAMPEIAQMLAEKAQELARMRAAATATNTFTEKNLQQLTALRHAIDAVSSGTGNVDSVLVTDNNAAAAAQRSLVQAQATVDAMKLSLRKLIEEIMNRHVLKLTNVTGWRYYRFDNLRGGLGVTDSHAVTEFEATVIKLLGALNDPGFIPVIEMRAYLTAVIKVLNGSTAVEPIMFSDLNELRMMVADDQMNFFKELKEYEEMKTDAAMKETEYKLMFLERTQDIAMQRKEIDEKIAMLERDRQMTDADAQAAAVAYGTIAANFGGNLAIVAPRTGIVSAILKNTGEFVEPGMPVATVNSGNNSERFVRFRIPGNMPTPAVNDALTIIRPGYLKDGKKVKVIGAGTSLDATGSYMADAKFIETVDWPVKSSVRVLPPPSIANTVLVPTAAVWWNDDAAPNVWLVTEEGLLRAQIIITGRVLGDKFEVLDGLHTGNQYVAKVVPGLKAGLALSDVQNNLNTPSSRPESGDRGGMDMDH